MPSHAGGRHGTEYSGSGQIFLGVSIYSRLGMRWKNES